MQFSTENPRPKLVKQSGDRLVAIITTRSRTMNVVKVITEQNKICDLPAFSCLRRSKDSVAPIIVQQLTEVEPLLVTIRDVYGVGTA